MIEGAALAERQTLRGNGRTDASAVRTRPRYRRRSRDAIGRRGRRPREAPRVLCVRGRKSAVHHRKNGDDSLAEDGDVDDDNRSAPVGGTSSNRTPVRHGAPTSVRANRRPPLSRKNDALKSAPCDWHTPKTNKQAKKSLSTRVEAMPPSLFIFCFFFSGFVSFVR